MKTLLRICGNLLHHSMSWNLEDRSVHFYLTIKKFFIAENHSFLWIIPFEYYFGFATILTKQRKTFLLDMTVGNKKEICWRNKQCFSKNRDYLIFFHSMDKMKIQEVMNNVSYKDLVNKWSFK